jgi:hypothetical protein
MTRTLAVVLILAVAPLTGPATAGEDTVTGTWTLTIENFPMRLVLAQQDDGLTGTLDYPHGAPFHLTGAFSNGRLTFSGDTTSTENFTMHIDATGTLETDGTLSGTIKAHFVEFNDAHEVVRNRDQDIVWTAVRTPQQ